MVERWIQVPGGTEVVAASDYDALAAELAEFRSKLAESCGHRMVAENRISQLETALLGLYSECCHAGHNSDKDYAWPAVMDQAKAALTPSETACKHSMEKMVTTNAGTVHVCEQCSGTRFVSYEADRGAK